jgi:hypothetical protein
MTDARPEWWIRKEGIYGIKRFVPDRIMQRWETSGSKVVPYYVPACTHCPAVRAILEEQA